MTRPRRRKPARPDAPAQVDATTPREQPGQDQSAQQRTPPADLPSKQRGQPKPPRPPKQRGQPKPDGHTGQPRQPRPDNQPRQPKPDGHTGQPRQRARPKQRARAQQPGQTPPEQRAQPDRRRTEQRTQPRQRARPVYRPRMPADSIRVQGQRGEFGESWWAQRWIDVLESFGFGSRLYRGRGYARSGAVMSMEVSEGRVVARVQGSRAAPYKVTIAVLPLSNAQWERAIDAMADQAIFTARLLAGEMPREIEQAFATAGVSLFPQSVHDLQTECTCPDYVNPCKHVAAVYYLLGERFDEDPFLAFALRGRGKERIIQALRARRADTAGDEALPVEAEAVGRVPGLEEQIERFDEPGPELDQIMPHIAAPAVASTMLRRYGPSPADTTMDLHALYLLMSRATLERLFAGE
jgi:uncharacterized Zn finger protein